MDELELQALADRMKAALATRDAELRAQLNALEQQVAELKSGRRGPIGVFGGGANPLQSDAVKTRFNLLREGALNTGQIMLPGVGTKNIKALISGPPGDSPSLTFPTDPQRGPVVPPAMRPLQLIDVLPHLPVSSNNFEFTQLVRTKAAGVQEGEGLTKPETEFETALKTTPIATVATHATASRQVLADNAGATQLETIIGRVLTLDCVDAFETLLLNGTGADGEFLGLVPQATLQASSAASSADRISEGITLMWADGFAVGAVVMNPIDWHTMRTERAEGGDGQYVAAGGWTSPAPPSVWNTPLVQSPALAQGSVLLIDLRRVTILDRMQVSVLASIHHADNFVKNLLTILAELRGGLAVYDTGAVGLVEIGGT